jgi:8-oxo-dGTP pyrophosphatase MutT (NUDIX family)
VTGGEPRRDVGDAGRRVAELVRAHVPADGREAAARDRFLLELARLRTPFDRGADPVHVTASAIVVGTRGVVLHRHRRLARWLQPGGHVDPGEPPAAAAVRETVEETGLDVSHPSGTPVLVHLDAHPAGDHVHLDLRYLLVARDAEPAPAPGESRDVRWFGWDEASAIADEALVGALRTARGHPAAAATPAVARCRP